MADRLWRAQCVIPLDSGVPEDSIVNTWYFDDDDDPVAAPGDTSGWIADQLQAFYQAIDGVLFPTTVATPMTIRLYDMAEPEPRQPVDTWEIPLTPSASQPLPNEVALCLSFAAANESGVPPARRRGRVFLGPVAESAVAVINSQSRPVLAVRETVRDAAAALMSFTHPASPGLHLKWSVFSPTTLASAGGSLASAFNDVVSGWVDDAWDTQRRRGAVTTARVTF